MSKMQHQFWVTKKCVLRKLGSKEDECVVSSDAELDAKLELFRSVADSCVHLQRVIDTFQERLCILAQDENALGRYLKESSKTERNIEVGKAMNAAGKAIAYIGHQRLALRPPLVRLHHEVETFRERAVSDSRKTVSQMEKARTEYRAALGWMKSASANLDPESGGLNNFRKAQTQVRVSKSNFDCYTLACLQKVDLLAAARCNMFSHALVLYENALSVFATKTGQVLGNAIGKIHAQPSDTVLSEAVDDQMFFNAEYTDSKQENDNELLSLVPDTSKDLLLDDPVESELNLLENDIKLESKNDFLPSQLLQKQTETSLKQTNSDRSTWYDLFSELDPLSNPDKLSGTHNEHAPA